MAPNVRSVSSSNVLLDSLPVFAVYLESLKEKLVLLIGPPPQFLRLGFCRALNGHLLLALIFWLTPFCTHSHVTQLVYILGKEIVLKNVHIVLVFLGYWIRCLRHIIACVIGACDIDQLFHEHLLLYLLLLRQDRIHL